MGLFVLMRHGYALFPEPGQRDFERALAPNGVEEARLSALQFMSLGRKPTRIICSPARRARETLDAVLEVFGLGMETVTLEPTLYESTMDIYLDLSRDIGADETVMVIGHNPMLEECALTLAENGDPAALDELQYGFGTAYIATFQAHKTGGFELESLITPQCSI